jgi:peptidoglycan lytic transglycosylase
MIDTPVAVPAPAPAAEPAPKAAAAPVTRSIKSASLAPQRPAAEAPAVSSATAPTAVTTITVVRPPAPAAHTDAPPSTAPQPFKTASTAPAPMHDTAPEPHMPKAVAALTVNRQTFKQDTRGYHSCATGERIITSFYWEGKRTASGEKFEPDHRFRFAAAHRSLPFGTRLMITNPRTGQSVIVTVNDRGPYVKGVTLDLTRSAALAIGMSGTGAVCMAKQ